MRIASLLPAATEMVCALGAGHDLVGVSHECDFPDEVRGRPVLTRARLHAPGPLSSAGIDAAVREILEGALALFEVDADALAAAAPDVILTQDLCDVCAVASSDVARAACAITGRDVRIVSLSPRRLGDVWDDLARVGAAIGRDAAPLRHALEARVAAVAARAAALPRVPTVTIEWIDPPMLGGLWTPELVRLAGGIALAAPEGEPAVWATPELLASLAPEVVIAKPCGFTLERALAEADALRAVLPTAWPAVQRGRVHVVDGSAYFNRPGPRLVESLEIAAACLHPEVFGDYLGGMRSAPSSRIVSPLR
jgi:iron complex transport system substrate-binding protein